MIRGTYDDGRHFLVVDDWSDAVAQLFEERDLQGGGYTWNAILDSLTRRADPPITGEFTINGEGANAHVDATDPAVLDRIEALATEAMRDLALLKDAIENADPELLE